ncbi:hypothetical protein CASFOL_031103 [Castilleja foliolosa]|uniref:FAD-binding FR-type domain-containing protein n=1 Tax=Castilleja foliolosa TaxID=1961234 RepID=A0ABD3C3S1_9LAMI
MCKLVQILKWDDHYISNIAGEISLLCGLALWVTTYPNIRRKMFELFLYTHYLYILFIIFFMLHAGIGFACIMLPGFYLFMIDRYLSRGLNYNPTSTIFINVPIISKLQWHPFTITSNSNIEQERLSVMIKCEGSWTKKLYNAISFPSSIDCLCVSVEGPYGPATTNFLRHDMLVMICGGSGIAPFISIIKELIFINSTQNCKISKIKLISVFKTSSYLSMLDLVPPTSQSNSCNLDLQIEAHITREKAQPKDKSQPIRTIQFNSNPSDVPIFPTLGPNSWLWLCTIISSSFVIFLVLLGLYNQYIVYPIDRNTNVLYSYTKKGLMNIFLICFSIVVASSGVFLWNKKSNAKVDKPIQEGEKLANTHKPLDDVELESFPLQSIIKSFNVHYGQRPNLKKLLLEIKETNVGVLVSGPKMMRQDVAAICSIGPANNLHFESISFTW